MFYFFIIFLFKLTLSDTRNNFESNEIQEKARNKEYKVYWNIPTFQCDSYKLNFSKLAEKYRITQNKNDRFRGEHIAILYDPGSFPAILLDGSTTFLRNGGVPQQGNVTSHFELFEETVNELIPDEEFSGIAIIDFESWRPIFRQNFGTLQPYKDLSVKIERRSHPLWPNPWIEKEAKNKFEFFGRKFVEETLYIAKNLRPNATWGYYAYPYCFNMSPNNMRTECPKEVQEENNRIDWLFELTDNFYPSIYLVESRLNAAQRVEMVEGRINECHRIVGYLNDKKKVPKIMPYFWYKYHDTRNFVAKEDLFNIFFALSSLNIDGLVLWGSSNDVNTKNKCLALYDYVDQTLGPLLINNL